MSGGSDADASYNEDEDYNNNPSSAKDNEVVNNAALAREISDSLRKMNKLVNNLMARADCVPFREPVDWKGLGLYDYPKIITKMMDLGTISKRLDKSKYNSASQCANDIRLVWQNCMTYNADGSDFYRLAESYSKRFEERYQKLLDEFGEDVIFGNTSGGGGRGGGGGERSSSRRPSLGANNNKSTASTGGRKSRSNSFASSGRNTPSIPHNNSSGNMSHNAEASSGDKSNFYNNEDGDNVIDTDNIIPLDVRTRFASRLQRLSGMELGYVLQQIDMNCPEAIEDPTPDQLRSDAAPIAQTSHNGHRYAWDEFDGGCQIEIDVDAISTETFWKLDTYVKEKVAGRGRGPWGDDLMMEGGGESGASGNGGAGGGGAVAGKKRKMKSF